jgi:thiamine monophosphate synthase
MSDLSQSFAQDPTLLIPIVAIGGAFIVAIVAIIFTSIRRIAVNSENEKSRREIAAYIAEGSMTPEQGEKLLASGKKNKG